MRLIKHILFVLSLVLFVPATWAQTESEIRKKADELFEKEAYIEATPLYLQLINLYPTDQEINFKYGTCSLFNDDKQKKDALKFLNAATRTESVDPRAFYFKGKALHWNYQFDEAKKAYQVYKNKRASKDNRYDVDREIEMCENGKKLMVTFTDILVSEKTQIEDDKFFRLYTDMQSIGGDILVTERFQSKVDKKKGHVPIVHFPKDAKAVYYASYGENENSGLDIYVRKKINSDTWGEPFRLLGEVNTEFDENFPYLHPNGRYLYFSSKGHNSMGGYDVFMARLNPDSEQFERPENVDFAICSPDDDLFYIVDSAYQNAYFASARQSEKGKLHVYKVRVVRVPIQEIIVMGDFASTINPDNKSMSIVVKSESSGAEIGKIVSNQAGKYSFVFPKGGKYKLDITVDGIDQTFTKTIDLPFLDEFKPLKQKIVHEMVNGNEVVRIIDLFGESVDGGEELIAQVLKEKANLDVNINDFDPKELEKIELEARQGELLRELGFQGMSIREVQNQLSELAAADAKKAEEVEQLNKGIANDLVTLSEQLEELQTQRDDLMAKAAAENDPKKQHALLTEASLKDAEAANVLSKMTGLVELKSEVKEKLGDGSGDKGQMADVEQTFNGLVAQGKEDEALTYLTSQKETIFEVKNASTEGIIENLVDESLELRARQEQLSNKIEDNLREIETAKANIQALESKLPAAKKKEAEQLNREIAQNKEAIAIFEWEAKLNKEDIAAIDRKLAGLETKLAALQNDGVGTTASVTPTQVERVIAEVNSNQNDSKGEEIAESLAKIERENPNLFSGGSDPVNSDQPLTQEQLLAAIDPTYENEVKRITNNGTGSELERLKALQNLDENLKEKAEERLAELQQTLESDPSNITAIQELGTLNDLLYETNEKIEDRAEKIDRIENQAPEVAITKEDLIAEIAPNYSKEVERIKSRANGSESDQLKALNAEDTRLESAIDQRLRKIDELLSSTPNDSELRGEKEVLLELKAETETAILKRNEQIASLESTTADPISVTETIEQVKPNYSNELEAIAENTNLSDLEKLEAQHVLDTELLNDLRDEQTNISNSLASNPNDPTLKRRDEGIKNALQEIENHLDERTQSINALKNVSSVIDPDATKSALETAVKGDYDQRLADINLSSGSEVQRNLDRLGLERELLTTMEQKLAEIETALDADPSNPQKQAERSAITELIAAQNAEVETQRNRTLEASMLADVYVRTIAAADKKYSVEIGDLTNDPNPSATKIAEREVEFQENLQAEIEKREKAILKKYTVEADLELMILQNEKRESEIREEVARNGSSIVNTNSGQDEEVFVANLREAFFPESELKLDNPSPTLQELRAHDDKLTDYQRELEAQRDATQEKLERTPDDEQVSNELAWIEAEQDKVEAERKRVQMEIGELETSSIADQNPTATDPQTAKLEAERAELLEELNDPNLSATEKKAIEQKLNENRAATVERSNEVQTEEIAAAQQKQDNLQNGLQQLGGNQSDSETVVAATKASEDERKAIDALLTKADQAKSEEERNYLLVQAQDRQDKLNENLQRVVENQEVINVEEESGITILSRAELEKRRRGFLVDIGELELEIDRLDAELATAKRNQVPSLTEEKKGAESQLELLQSQLKQIETRLAEMDVEEPVNRIAKAGLDQEISFNEERVIAASDNYKAYQTEGVKALEIENQMRTLQQDLDEEREELLTLLAEPKTEERDAAIEQKARTIQELEAELQILNTEFNEQMDVANRLLPADKEEAMKIQNLLARGVQPLKTAVVATALIQMPSTGFAIDRTGESIYSEANPIPVDVKNPTGLTYRVQVGAFAKPIPQDLFKEFNPVSGEKIENTNVVRYMAGFFNNSDSVINAREAIRGLGYADAFVVAYCDGERISFAEARRRELAGECVPKGRNELAMEVAVNTAEKLGIPLVNELQTVSEFAYNQAPGAVKAAPIELKQGLFFTIQVGVFNRPVAESEVKNMPELLTVRLPNGLIRYSSGMFDSVEEALPRRTEAQNRGISDAFVVAYYKGERITIARAKQLLEENGPSILQSSSEKTVPVAVVETIPANQQSTTVTTPVVEAPIEEVKKEQRIQIVSKKTFVEYPRDVLNRYNTEGNFYFDESDGKVKSEIYETENAIPRLYKFEKDIDTVYLSLDEVEIELDKKQISVKLPSEKVPGDLADWLIRMGYQKKFVRGDTGLELRIEGIEPNRLQDVQYRIREVGLEPIVIERVLEEVEDK